MGKANFYRVWLGDGSGLLEFMDSIIGRRDYAEPGESDYLIVDKGVLDYLGLNPDPSDAGYAKRSLLAKLRASGISVLLDTDVFYGVAQRKGEDFRPVREVYGKLVENGLFANASDLLRFVFPQHIMHTAGTVNIYSDCDVKFNKSLETLDMAVGLRMVAKSTSRANLAHNNPSSSTIRSHQGSSRAIRLLDDNYSQSPSPPVGADIDLFAVETGSVGADMLFDNVCLGSKKLLRSTYLVKRPSRSLPASYSLLDFKGMRSDPYWGSTRSDDYLSRNAVADRTAVFVMRKTINELRDYMASQFPDSVKLKPDEWFSESKDGVKIGRSMNLKIFREFLLDPREVGACSVSNGHSWQPSLANLASADLEVSDDDESVSPSAEAAAVHYTLPEVHFRSFIDNLKKERLKFRDELGSDFVSLSTDVATVRRTLPEVRFRNLADNLKKDKLGSMDEVRSARRRRASAAVCSCRIL